MEILNQDLQNQLIGLIQIIIGGLLSIASIYCIIFINKYTAIAKEKLNAIQDKNAKDKLDVVLDRLNSLLVTNITNAETTLKKELVKGIEDGSLTKEDFTSLKESVINKVINQLGNDSIKLITDEVGDLRDYVGVKLEETLAELKENPNSVVQHTVINK